jgi:glycosyltransferase involved in cell wall biosynthesis
MRVLVVTSHSDRSETCLYRRLRETGIELEAVCDPAFKQLDALRAGGVPVHPIRFRSRVGIAAWRALRNLLRTGGFDLVHAFSKRALTHVMLAARGWPGRILTYRGIIGNLSRWNPETRWTFFSPRLSGIICVCDAVREYLLSVGLSPARLRRIYKGHDLAWYAPAEPSALGVLGIPPGAFVVGCAAHMRARKGLTTLVEAAARMPKGSVHFLLLGTISDPKVRPLMVKHGLESVMHAPGFREDGAALMGACDLFVMPSLRREGLPRAVIEAMAQGVPAVVTNVGGMPEIVEHQKSGLIVEPADPRALADAIQFFANDRAQVRAFGARARERIQTRFDIEETVRQTAQFYRELLVEGWGSRLQR